MRRWRDDDSVYLVGAGDHEGEITVFPNHAGLITLVAVPDDDNVPIALTADDADDLAALLTTLAAGLRQAERAAAGRDDTPEDT
jgi:hypothetical protein